MKVSCQGAGLVGHTAESHPPVSDTTSAIVHSVDHKKKGYTAPGLAEDTDQRCALLPLHKGKISGKCCHEC